ncbi:hypothetical protein D3C72_704950 [compost metagenome]
MLLHRQLVGTEVLAVLLADVTQVPVVAAIFQVGRHTHLRHAAGRVGGEGLQALDFVLIAPGDHPANAHAGGQGLGKTRAIDHPVQPVECLERLGLALLEHQLAIDVILDDLDIEIRRQAQQLLLPLFRDSATQRVAEARSQNQGLDRPLVRRQLQRLEADTGGRVAGDLDHLQAQQVGQLQQPVIGGRFGGDQVAGAGQHAQRHLQRIDTAMGHDHFTRVDQHTGITHANGDLPAQRLETRAEHVAEGTRAVEARDLGNLLVQGTDRQVVDVRHSGAEREHAITASLGQHLLDDTGAGDQAGALHPGDVRGLRGQGRGLVHVVAGLRPRTDQPLVLEIGIGLQHRGMADIELGAHLAHGGYPLAWLVDTTTDVIGQLLGDTLVQQQVGHGWLSTRGRARCSCVAH